ncbi:MAG: CDP-diacylglycerol--serine O-phosphatidyltransferase [Burkholderiales bacterium]
MPVQPCWQSYKPVMRFPRRKFRNNSQLLSRLSRFKRDDVHGLPRRRGIYLLPNLLTTASLFCGFFAIVQAMNQRFEVAAISIFIAMIFDGLDGRIARMTNTQSAFGAEYDSLSDMVTFGAAPALIIYEWALKGMGKLGWIAAFIYVACAALRLARFNTNIDVVDKRYFQGLPSPAAAGLVVGLVWILHDYQISGRDVNWLAWGFAVYAGLTMVSNVPFYSGKEFNLRKSVPFVVMVIIALIFVAVAYDPPTMLFAAFCAYGLSGYFLYLWRRYRGEPTSLVSTQVDSDSDQDSRNNS